MAAIVQQSTRHWKESAIERSEAITDAWEVCKAYLGRAAEVVLFLCLILSLVEVLPGVQAPLWFADMVIGVQAVMLDIGGFALASLADHARQHGNEQAASRAERTGKILIGIVILTVALLVGGVIIPAIRPYTNDAELVLLLVRVIMTVIYGHVLHSLRRSSLSVHPVAPAPAASPQIDYSEIARQLLPLVAQEVRQIVPDTTGMVEQLTQLRNDMEALTGLVARPSETIDETNNEAEGETNITSFEDAKFHLKQKIDETEMETEEVLTPRITRKLTQEKSAAKRETKRETRIETNNDRGAARQKALRVIKRTPDINATELAKRAGITPQYAGQILKQQSVN